MWVKFNQEYELTATRYKNITIRAEAKLKKKKKIASSNLKWCDDDQLRL